MCGCKRNSFWGQSIAQIQLCLYLTQKNRTHEHIYTYTVCITWTPTHPHPHFCKHTKGTETRKDKITEMKKWCELRNEENIYVHGKMYTFVFYRHLRSLAILFNFSFRFVSLRFSSTHENVMEFFRPHHTTLVFCSSCSRTLLYWILLLTLTTLSSSVFMWWVFRLMI